MEHPVNPSASPLASSPRALRCCHPDPPVCSVRVANTVSAPLRTSQSPHWHSHAQRHAAVPLADATRQAANSGRKALSLARKLFCLARKAPEPRAQAISPCAQAKSPCAQAAELCARHKLLRAQANKPCAQGSRGRAQAKTPCAQSKTACTQSKKPCAPSLGLCAQGPMACGWGGAGGAPGGAARRCITARCRWGRQAGCGERSGRPCLGEGPPGPSPGPACAAGRSPPARRSSRHCPGR